MYRGVMAFNGQKNIALHVIRTLVAHCICGSIYAAVVPTDGSMKLLIDADVGIDDAEGILVALGQPHVDLVGITCVQGNADIDQVAQNVLRVLQVADRLDIPVYKGAVTSLLGEQKRDDFHGNDGLGDAPDPDAPDVSLVQSEYAVDALIRYANEMPGELTIAAVGPLTNIALAIKRDPTFTSKLKQVMIMGGNVEGQGNTKPTLAAEFNFWSDSEAAYIVLNEIDCPVSIVTWEVTLREYHNPSDEWFMQWIEGSTAKAKFVKTVRQNQIDAGIFRDQGFFLSCDAMAIAAVVQPDMVKSDKTETKFATVELSGKWTRGMMVIDWMGLLEMNPNIDIIMEIDRNVYIQLLEQALE